MAISNHEQIPLADATLQDLFNPKDASAHAYLDHLTTLDLPTLVSEPTVLQTQAHHLTSSLTSLTHTSYPTFISLHEATQALSTSLESLSFSLDSLVDESLPALDASVAEWQGRTEDVLGERQRARVVLEQHDKIRDLLDIPLLIDTCVRNGYFSEALSLASHATSLASNYRTKFRSLPPFLLTSVLSEVQNSVTQMLLSLLATLHEPSRKLPALFKAVTFLRKMDVFAEDREEGNAEEKIALAFLTGREACFKSAREGPARDIARLQSEGTSRDERDDEDLIRSTRKYIDIWRESLYDIITQYNTIFLERSPYSAHNSAKSPGVLSSATKQNFSQPIPTGSLHRLIATYASHALSRHLLPILSSTLPHLPMSALPSFLTQLTYCSTAFARVGLEFRSLLPSLFETAVLSAFRRDLEMASSAWSTKIRNVSGSMLGDDAKRVLVSPLSPSRRKSLMQSATPPSRWLAPPAVLLTSVDASGGSVTSPPQILTSFPPLAEYANGILTTFNNLRMLAPTSLTHATQEILDDVLADFASQFLAYVKVIVSSSLSSGEEKSMKEEEQEGIVRKAGEALFGVLVPYLRRALREGVYGSVEGEEGGANEKLGVVIGEWENWQTAFERTE